MPLTRLDMPHGCGANQGRLEALPRLHPRDVLLLEREHPGGGEGASERIVGCFTDTDKLASGDSAFKVFANISKRRFTHRPA